MLRFINNEQTTTKSISSNSLINIASNGRNIYVESPNDVHVDVFNLQGMSVYKTTGAGKIDLGVFQQGVYIVKARSSMNESLIKKVLIYE